jgi:hypothetical protein
MRAPGGRTKPRARRPHPVPHADPRSGDRVFDHDEPGIVTSGDDLRSEHTGLAAQRLDPAQFGGDLGNRVVLGSVHPQEHRVIGVRFTDPVHDVLGHVDQLHFAWWKVVPL